MKSAAQNVSGMMRAANAFASAGARGGAGPDSEKALKTAVDCRWVEAAAEKPCSISPVREAAKTLKQATRRAAAEKLDQSGDGSQFTGRYEEGCSCLYGTPCTETNSHACGDWHRRFDIARRHGWQGF